MDLEESNLTPKGTLPAPPVLPWREFADWIRNGYLPSHKVGKHVMVNVALLTTQLLEKESTL